jgi:gliding motility-associated lipoprotein GldH
MKKILRVALLTFLLACHPEGRVYVEHYELEDLAWQSKQAIPFTVEIEESGASYRMSLAFRYAEGFQYDRLPVLVIETTPEGKENMYRYTLQIKNEEGDYIGDPGYDIWDLEQVVDERKNFPRQGTYQYKILHQLPVEPLHLAMEVGLILDKTEK